MQHTEANKAFTPGWAVFKVANAPMAQCTTVYSLSKEYQDGRSEDVSGLSIGIGRSISFPHHTYCVRSPSRVIARRLPSPGLRTKIYLAELGGSRRVSWL